MARTSATKGGGSEPRGRLAFVAVLATTFPSIAGIPSTLPVASGTVWYTDLLLPVAAFVCYGQIRNRRGIGLALLLLASALALAAVGLLMGAEPRWILRDSRQLAYLGLGAVIGLYLVRDRANWPWFVRCTAAYLASVAGLVVLSQVTPTALVGRSADETLYLGETAVDLGVRRAQFETNPLFLLVLASSVGSAVAGMRLSAAMGRRAASALVLAAGVVVFLSYSRNSVLAIIAALMCGLVVPVGRPRADRVVRVSVIAMVVAGLAFATSILAAQLGILSGQVAAFQTRVLGGLTGEALSTDAGIAWRDRESALALEAAETSPIYGRGAGVFYRPHVAGEPFSDAGGRLYVHNYYLWVLVKGGVLYLALILAVIGVGLRGLLTSRERCLSALGCGLVGILAAGWVAPWAAQGTMAAVIGALLAAGASQPAHRQVQVRLGEVTAGGRAAAAS